VCYVIARIQGINPSSDPALKVTADGVDVSVVGKAEEKELLKQISPKRSVKPSQVSGGAGSTVGSVGGKHMKTKSSKSGANSAAVATPSKGSPPAGASTTRQTKRGVVSAAPLLKANGPSSAGSLAKKTKKSSLSTAVSQTATTTRATGGGSGAKATVALNRSLSKESTVRRSTRSSGSSRATPSVSPAGSSKSSPKCTHNLHEIPFKHLFRRPPLPCLSYSFNPFMDYWLNLCLFFQPKSPVLRMWSRN
jgi:hypothetical protein